MKRYYRVIHKKNEVKQSSEYVEGDRFKDNYPSLHMLFQDPTVTSITMNYKNGDSYTYENRNES